MAFRRGGGKKRRDANEKDIRGALAALGAHVFQISGDGLPDLLVLWKGTWMPLEVKTAKGRFTSSQTALLWPVVRSVGDVFVLLGVQPIRDGKH